MGSLLFRLLLVLCTIILIFLNLLALMRLLSPFITLPLLFVCLYITLYTFSQRRAFRYRERN